ncbi:MAG: Gfo/Idh/MocA family oxidoreductase [Eubacteriales bacterium]|nr:Gfo/Idh/MocA family oxidoreductase [Eubacteriales bacterium]
MRFLIIGTGYIGPVNTAALMECDGVEIAGVFNRTIEKAEAMCAKLGLECPVFNDIDMAISEVKPDVAVINLFNDLHRDFFVRCATKGINILIEKPLANTYEECIEMMDIAEEYGIKVSVLQTQRYGCVLTTAKQYIDMHRNELGELCSVSDQEAINYFWEGRNPWHLDEKRSGGGIVLNYGVHQLDRIHWLMEDTTAEFHAKYLTMKPGIETKSSYVMMGVSTKGIPYTASCNGYCSPYINEITLNYQNATMRLVLSDNGLNKKGVYIGSNETEVFTEIPLTCEDGEGWHEMYVREMKDAVSYLKGETDNSPVSMEWAAEMVRLCCLGFSV